MNQQITSIAPPKKMYAFEEYLEREEKSLFKHEFYNGKIIKMLGGTIKHNEIATNVTTSLKYAIKPLPKKYRVLNSDQKIYIESENKAVYADVLVVCDHYELWNDRKDIIVNPLLIVEVLSNSTNKYEKSEKFMLYQQLKSFKEYILIEQNKPLVETWFQQSQNTWNKMLFSDINQSLMIRSIGVEIAMKDIYENIEF